MKFKLHTDLINALGKGAGGLKAVVNPPQWELDEVRQTLDDINRVTDGTLRTVIIRRCSVLPFAAGADTLCEAVKLQRYPAGLLPFSMESSL